MSYIFYEYDDMDYSDDEKGIYGRRIEADINYSIEEVVVANTPRGQDIRPCINIDSIEAWVTYYDRDGGEHSNSTHELDKDVAMAFVEGQL